ncbi:MAG: RcnB family protein [Arenimonas sp.]
MKKSLLAAATALLLLGSAGTASAQSAWHDRDHDGVRNSRDRHDDRRDDRGRNDRDCDGRPNRYDQHDNRSAHDRDCDGISNRFDRHDGRAHDARRSYGGVWYAPPRGYRYARYSYGTRLPAGYWGGSYYIDYAPYGLAPPPRGYRWNRVGRDVYLIDVRNGLIAEAVYSLFR